jgi:hypothetical protein
MIVPHAQAVGGINGDLTYQNWTGHSRIGGNST